MKRQKTIVKQKQLTTFGCFFQGSHQFRHCNHFWKLTNNSSWSGGQMGLVTTHIPSSSALIWFRFVVIILVVVEEPEFHEDGHRQGQRFFTGCPLFEEGNIVIINVWRTTHPGTDLTSSPRGSPLSSAPSPNHAPRSLLRSRVTSNTNQVFLLNVQLLTRLAPHKYC